MRQHMEDEMPPAYSPRQNIQPQQSHSRPVFNYTLPDSYLDPNSRHMHSKNGYLDVDGFNRNMFINPQQLMVASPISPAADHMDYAFPIAPYPVQSSPPAYEEREYVNVNYGNVGHRKQRSLPGSWPQKSYSPQRSSGHRSRHSHSYASTLPTPPSSPTHTIPTAATGTTSIPNTANHSTSTKHHNHHASPAISMTPTTSTTTSNRHFCYHPTCLEPGTQKPLKSFSRRADLQRHHGCTHDTPALFSCPRLNCIRKGDNGFTRQDHLIEHRRGYHGEAIPKRGQRGRGVSRERSPRRRG